MVAANAAAVNGEAELMKLRLKPTKQSGEATVVLTSAELSCYLGQESETFVLADLSQAALTVQVRYNRYDVNHDGVVNLLDVTRAQRYYGTDNATCDVNDDGQVDIADLILILNHCEESY